MSPYFHFWEYSVLVKPSVISHQIFLLPLTCPPSFQTQLLPIYFAYSLQNSALILILPCHGIPASLPYVVDYLLRVIYDKAGIPSQEGHDPL